jgi:uncharacterized protein (DUF4415 family)
MKKRKPVKRRKVQKTIARLEASVGSSKRRLAPPADWAEYYKPIKKPVTLRLDADILAWFQRNGRGYQTRINQALRKLMMDGRKRSE